MDRKVLVLDDDPFTVEDLVEGLREADYRVTVVQTFAEAKAKLLGEDWLALFLDFRLESSESGLDLLPTLRRQFPNVPVVMITGQGEYDVAVEAIKRGAFHFLRKPVDLAQTFAVLKNIEEIVRLREEREHLLQRLRSGQSLLASRNRQMQKVEKTARRVARSNLTVLIYGESGTGKEVLAQYIHGLSSRSEKPFVPVNCASIPEALMESEFFGHERGAFTGAIATTKGKVEIADGGTLFLDEIGDMPLSLQAKMLRFLENREFQRVGGTETRYADVRVIAATHRNLEELIDKNGFRRDLYYRINQIQLTIPPLRDRKEDIVPLAQHFLDLICRQMGLHSKRLSAGAIARLLAYDFPGNVRELRNVMERTVILHDGELVDAEDLAMEDDWERNGTSSRKTFKEAVEDFKRRYIAAVLKEFDGNQTKAAKHLGVSRSYLNVLMRQLGLRG